MKEIMIDTLIDSVKLIPFLFIVFLLMEFFEHKLSKKTKKSVEKSGRFGPVIGGILGAFPQCGFSVAATNLYAAKLITVGTLVSIYLSTSDEMLPILLSNKYDFSLIIKIVGLKVIISIFFGILIDLFWKQKEPKDDESIHKICEHNHCGCEKNIFSSALKHTFNITIYIFLITLLLNALIYFIGMDAISKLLMKNSLLEPIFTSLVGLIPNCAASVIITELYLNHAISFGALMSGLLTGSGVALMVLFKENKKMRDNVKILFIIYFIGVIIGILFNLLGVSL